MRELVRQTDKFGVIHFGDFDCSGFGGPEGVGVRFWAGNDPVYGSYVGNDPLYLWREVLKADLPFDAACQRAKRYQFW